MKIKLRNKYLSTQRFNRYLVATDYNNTKAKKLYAGNISLAKAFHPVLSQFEVVLRNNINTILSTHFADEDWIINQKNKFMSHDSLASSGYFLRKRIQKAENNLKRRSLPIIVGNIISEQMFGFWLAFFTPHNYAILEGKPMLIFPHKPFSENRTTIYTKLEKIKNFRNRVNHCEPICFRGKTIDCNYALHIRSTLYDLISWMEPDLATYFKSIDTIPSKCNTILSI